MTNRVRRSGPGVADLPTRTAAPLSSPPPPPPYAYVEETANGARRWTPAANVVAAPVVMPLPVPPPLPVTAAPPRTHFAQATPPPPQQQQQQRQQPAAVPAARASDPRSTLFSGRFTLLDCLGSGGFGDVYRAEERDQGVPLAVKVEQVTETNSRPDQSFLFHEAKVLQDIHKSIQSRCAKLKSEREARLQRGGQRDEADDSPPAELNPDAVGITKLKYYGQDGMQRVLIMSLHGHSVESVHRRQGRLSLYATVIIADQVLSSLEHVHRAGYVHADLKPDNILFGRSDPEQLYLIDFGLSVRYRDREGKHRPLITNHSFVGTPRYASLRTHMGYTLSRRDDIEQLVYVMIYLFRGRLPWSGLRIDDPDRKEKHIAQMKANISLDAICAGCPEAFRDVLNYARCMSFEEDPEYEYLHLLLYSLREACTSGAGSEVLRIPAPPVKEAHQHQQQQQQQQAPRHAHVNAPVQVGKTRESAAAEGATSNFTSHPNIVSNFGNDEEGGDANPLVSPREDGSPGLFSDAIGQGILSGNATDAGPLSPRIDCLDGGESPTCLPLGSPMPCALP